MTTFDPNAVRAQIKTLITTAPEIAYVYDYANPDIEGFPAVILDISSEQSEMFDDSGNLRTIQFTIWIIQEISTAGEQTAKSQLDAAVKSVVGILEKKSNDTLSGTVDWIMPVMGRRSHIATPSGAAFMLELLLSAKVYSSIL